MLVTLMTDASFCHDTRAGGYGFWAISERAKLGGGGPLKNRVSGACAAEMMAVVNGLDAARKQGVAETGDHFLVQVDSMDAIARFNGRVQPNHSDEKDALIALNAFTREHGVTVSFRHVKAHSGKKDQRSRANQHCDRRAKEGMRTARQGYRQSEGANGNGET